MANDEQITTTTSPIIREPTHLTSEALRPASTDDVMAALSRVGSTPPPTRAKPPTGTRRPRRTAAQIKADENPDLAKVQEADKKREAKKARAVAIEGQILTELNDQLMTIIIGSFNVPANFLYLPGKEPTVAVKSDRFTDLGNAFAIPPGLAKSIGRLAAELEQTELGSKATGLTENSNVGLIVAAAMTIFGSVQYARKLTDTLDKVKPLLDARKEWMARQAPDGSVSNPYPAEPQSNSDVMNSGSVA